MTRAVYGQSYLGNSRARHYRPQAGDGVISGIEYGPITGNACAGNQLVNSQLLIIP